MLSAIKKGADINADLTLREELKENSSCKSAALASSGNFVANLFMKGSGNQGRFDFLLDVLLMRCLGFTQKQYVQYFVGLTTVALATGAAFAYFVPMFNLKHVGSGENRRECNGDCTFHNYALYSLCLVCVSLIPVAIVRSIAIFLLRARVFNLGTFLVKNLGFLLFLALIIFVLAVIIMNHIRA